MTPSIPIPQFVILEGIDGGGKTTIAHGIVDAFHNAGFPAIYAKAPGQTEVGAKIREIVVDNPGMIKDPYTRQLLFIADHRELFTQVVLPALDAGVTVVLDRFIDSTMAYAIGALELDPQFIAVVCSLVFPADRPFTTPHVLWLTLPVEVALERLGKRALDGSDHMYMDKLGKIQDFYKGSWKKAITETRGPTWTPINANQPADVVLSDALAALGL